MTKQRGGNGTGAAGAATAVLLLALLVLAASQADGADDMIPPNGCTTDPNSSGPPCHGQSPPGRKLLAAEQADPSPATGKLA
jgi:hypothetical protein